MQFRILTIFGTALLITGCFQEKRKVAILFDKPYDLEVGSKVYNNGLDIGEVESIDLSGSKIVASITLDDQYKIPVDSRFIIKNSLIGPASIDIKCSNRDDFISSKDTVLGQYYEQKLFDTLVQDSTKREKIRESLHKIDEGISELAKTAKDSVKGSK